MTTRTTRARTATTKTASSVVVAATVKKAAIRRPLLNRENSAEADSDPKASSKLIVRKTTLKKQANVIVGDTEREPVMAFLRIRPYLGNDEASPQPYLTPLSDTSVRMADPNEQQIKAERFRSSTLSPSSIYTFSHVFPPDTIQSDFFTRTTLPLVQDVLQGHNGLLFTYGVTNSGKTYTVQGGTKAGSAGILPRSLDVIFNSIDGLHGDGKFRPVRLQGVEPADPSDSKAPHVLPEPSLTEVFGQPLDISASDTDVDPTVLKVDRNHEYTIWLSYAEVYNEKVYDLLESVKDGTDNAGGGIPRATTAKSMTLTRTALPLKPSPASDNGDSAAAGKYISGLRQFRVHSASQAKALVKLGQLHRRVFGTLANSESSRSHGMVIIKVVRGHRGEKDDPTSLQISRLTLVDLAGSERTKHTHTTGDRLREAGNINKSLMVLGQCMEVMRSNQRKLAMSLAHEGSGQDGRMDTRDVRKTLAVIPFRHSKLTEALMDYFIGDGKAVMIVNVNPYDTGYDENSHVMRFAALAREVYVTPAPAPVHRMKGPGKTNGETIKELGPMTLKDPEIVPLPHSRRKVTISMGGRDGRKPREAIVEVLEEDEPDDGQATDDEPINPLVDALFDEIENLRLQLFESEMQRAIIEAETREEVMREMEARMRSMEEMYSRRLMKELEQNELKTDAKIDMLHRSGLFASPVKRQIVRRPPSENSEDEAGVEMSLVDHGQDEESEEASEIGRSPLSPLAKKGREKSQMTLDTQSSTSKVNREVRKFVPNKPLLSDNEEAELTETEIADDASVAASGTVGSEIDEDEDYDDDAYSEENDEDDWVPPSTSARNKTSKPKTGAQPVLEDSTLKSHRTRVAKLAQDIDGLSLSGPDDSMVILPVKNYKGRRSSSNFDNDDDDEEGERLLPTVKKKKRQLGKKSIMTEEEIERTTSAVERNAAKAAGRNNIRRLTGR
ncbi:Kinesin-like protein KIF20B [Termitomyces sp. T112]|nr:Kinesin-like protein KIF20B [Termitomyces sp. T112]